MTRYYGNQNVDPGIYLNLRELSFKSLDDEGRLPGKETNVYYRVPALVLLVAAPLLGLVYAIFLPLIGFMMLGAFLASKFYGLAKQAADATVLVLRPAWQPARAFLTRGKRAKGEEQAAKPKDAWAEKARAEAQGEKESEDREEDA
jgi:hypothetical protein